MLLNEFEEEKWLTNIWLSVHWWYYMLKLIIHVFNVYTIEDDLKTLLKYYETGSYHPMIEIVTTWKDLHINLYKKWASRCKTERIKLY